MGLRIPYLREGGSEHNPSEQRRKGGIVDRTRRWRIAGRRTGGLGQRGEGASGGSDGGGEGMNDVREEEGGSEGGRGKERASETKERTRYLPYCVLPAVEPSFAFLTVLVELKDLLGMTKARKSSP